MLPDGSVWVLNSVEPYFLGLDADGNPLGEYGTMGGGPEEFGVPSAFVTGGVDGAAWAFDYRRPSLIKVGGPVWLRITAEGGHHEIPSP